MNFLGGIIGIIIIAILLAGIRPALRCHTMGTIRTCVFIFVKKDQGIKNETRN